MSTWELGSWVKALYRVSQPSRVQVSAGPKAITYILWRAWFYQAFWWILGQTWELDLDPFQAATWDLHLEATSSPEGKTLSLPKQLPAQKILQKATYSWATCFLMVTLLDSAVFGAFQPARLVWIVTGLSQSNGFDQQLWVQQWFQARALPHMNRHISTSQAASVQGRYWPPFQKSTLFGGF